MHYLHTCFPIIFDYIPLHALPSYVLSMLSIYFWSFWSKHFSFICVFHCIPLCFSFICVSIVFHCVSPSFITFIRIFHCIPLYFSFIHHLHTCFPLCSIIFLLHSSPSYVFSTVFHCISPSFITFICVFHCIPLYIMHRSTISMAYRSRSS
jgi:hypothetical protein